VTAYTCVMGARRGDEVVILFYEAAAMHVDGGARDVGNQAKTTVVIVK
jgi:hypothetical protein